MNIAVFASGEGSNLQAIHRAINSGELDEVNLALVISNNSASGAMHFARGNRIPAAHLSLLKSGGSERKFIEAILAALDTAKIDLIVLAGYMKKLPDKIVEEYSKRIINIHPALLPKFGGEGMFGLKVHEAVLAAGEKMSGATVHYVDKVYDSGKIILQDSCRIVPNDSPERLQERIKTIEHKLLPKAIAKVIKELQAQ